MIRNIRINSLIILLTSFISCASVPAINYEVKPNLEKEMLFPHLVRMAEKCLYRDGSSGFVDYKIVKHGELENGDKVITLHHYASDIGVRPAELFIVISQDGSVVKVKSDEISDMTKAQVNNRAANIERIRLWANGDSQCAEIS